MNLFSQLTQKREMDISRFPGANVLDPEVSYDLLSPGEQREGRALVVVADSGLLKLRGNKSITIGASNIQPPARQTDTDTC